MRVEARDRKHPSLICVATVADVMNGQVLIHFDGWSNDYDYWCVPDCGDIFPVGWCQQNNKELQPPKST